MPNHGSRQTCRWDQNIPIENDRSSINKRDTSRTVSSARVHSAGGVFVGLPAGRSAVGRFAVKVNRFAIEITQGKIEITQGKIEITRDEIEITRGEIEITRGEIEIKKSTNKVSFEDGRVVEESKIVQVG